MKAPRQIMVPPQPELEEITSFNYGVFFVGGWFYKFVSIVTSFYPQEAFLKKRILDPEDEDGDFREVTERQPNYLCPKVRTWHVSKCRPLGVEAVAMLYSYKGVVNSLSGLQNLFPRVSISELTMAPISPALRPSERWQPVKWNSDFDQWVTENFHLPREERQPPRITRTLRPEYSLAAARYGMETLARRQPLPFLDDSRKD